MRAITSPALLLTTLILTACNADAPTAPFTSLPQATVAPLPLTGSCTITSTQMLGFTPPILNQVGTATCQVSHLGHVSLRTTQQINVVTGVQLAQSTWTTANGDLLYSTAVGAATPTGPTTLRFSGVTTITGGTGRFTNASGELAASGALDTAAGTGTLAYDGWVTYDAWQRSDR